MKIRVGKVDIRARLLKWIRNLVPNSPAVCVQLKRHTDALLAQGLIQEIKFPWSNQPVLVEKPVCSTRMCIDFRDLNRVTKKKVYPIPAMEA